MSAILRPSIEDLRLIGFYLGRVLTGLGLLMLVPLPVAAVLREWNALAALVLGASIALTLGALADAHLRSRRQLGWSHGMVVVALAWIVGSALAACSSGKINNFI